MRWRWKESFFSISISHNCAPIFLWKVGILIFKVKIFFKWRWLYLLLVGKVPVRWKIFIPQGTTVNNNLGPDRIAGLKALTCQILRITNLLIALDVLAVSVCMVMNCTCFRPWHSYYLYYQYIASDIAVVCTTSLAITRFGPKI